MTTTVNTTIDYHDSLTAAVVLTQFAQREREAAEQFRAHPAMAEHAISQAEACERVAAALDRMRARS